MFAATDGIGFVLVQYQRTFAIPEMWSGIILLGIIGIALSLIFRADRGLAVGLVLRPAARAAGELIMNERGNGSSNGAHARSEEAAQGL